MSEEKLPLIPKGYKLVLRRKSSCFLCQRPEFRGDWDEAIWSRKIENYKLTEMIKEEFDIDVNPAEVQAHGKHLELFPDSEEELKKYKQMVLDEVVNREKDLLDINLARSKIVVDFDSDLEGKIKSLSAELTDLKLQGFDNAPQYSNKFKEYKSLCELRYKQRGEIKDETTCLITLEVDKIFEEYEKVKEKKANEQKKK